MKFIIEEKLGVEVLTTVIMNFDSDVIEKYNEMIGALYGRGSYTYTLQKLNMDLKNRTTPPSHPSIEKPLVLESKALASYLRYAFLWANNKLLVIIAAALMKTKVEALLPVLKFKWAIGWSIVDIIVIPPEIGTHKIKLEPDFILSIEHRWWLNPPKKEVVEKKKSLSGWTLVL